MKSTIEEFARAQGEVRHHAVLLTGSKLAANGIEWNHLSLIARNYCQIFIQAEEEEEFWTKFSGHPDVGMVPRDAARIKIEHIALLREQTFYQATFGTRKLILIDRCERPCLKP